jgi:hypothetical protein
LEAKDDVDQLATFMKANEMDGAKSVHFVFPNDASDGPQTSNHIAINVSGFSNGLVSAICAALGADGGASRRLVNEQRLRRRSLRCSRVLRIGQFRLLRCRLLLRRRSDGGAPLRIDWPLQMSYREMCFLLTFPRRGFVLAVRDSDLTNKNEISISVFGVTTKDFSHGRNLDEASLTQLTRDYKSDHRDVCGALLAAQEVERNFSDTPRFVVIKPHLMRPTRPATSMAGVRTWDLSQQPTQLIR